MAAAILKVVHLCVPLGSFGWAIVRRFAIPALCALQFGVTTPFEA